jgi:hypothetical protein
VPCSRHPTATAGRSPSAGSSGSLRVPPGPAELCGQGTRGRGRRTLRRLLFLLPVDSQTLLDAAELSAGAWPRWRNGSMPRFSMSECSTAVPTPSRRCSHPAEGKRRRRPSDAIVRNGHRFATPRRGRKDRCSDKRLRHARAGVGAVTSTKATPGKAHARAVAHAPARSPSHPRHGRALPTAFEHDADRREVGVCPARPPARPAADPHGRVRRA